MEYYETHLKVDNSDEILKDLNEARDKIKLTKGQLSDELILKKNELVDFEDLLETHKKSINDILSNNVEEFIYLLNKEYHLIYKSDIIKSDIKELILWTKNNIHKYDIETIIKKYPEPLTRNTFDMIKLIKNVFKYSIYTIIISILIYISSYLPEFMGFNYTYSITFNLLTYIILLSIFAYYTLNLFNYKYEIIDVGILIKLISKNSTSIFIEYINIFNSVRNLSKNELIELEVVKIYKI